VPDLLPQDFFRFLESSSDLIVIVRDGRLVYANAAFARALGYEAKELVGVVANTLAHPDERESVTARIRSTVAGDQTPLLRRRLLRRDGREVLIEATTFPMQLEGSPVAVLVGHDLTMREEARRERQLHENDFKTLVENLPGGVLVHVRGKVLFANSKMAKLLDVPADHLVGASVMQFVPPSWAEMAKELIERNAETGQALPLIEYPIRTRDGVSRVVELSGIAIRFEGQFARLVYVNDVTNQRSAERRLRALVESSPLAICSMDPQGRMVSCNPAAERMLSFRFGQTEHISLDVEANTDHMRQVFAQAAREGFATSELQLTRRADGKPLMLRTYVTPIHDGEGSLEGYVTTTDDITAERQAVDLLRAAAEEWQATFDAVDAAALLLDGPSREIARINRAARELAGPGASSLAALSGREPWTTAAQVVDAAARTNAPASEQARADGRVWLVSASPLRLGRLILIMADVTRVTRLQDSLRRSEAMSAMGELVAGVAHEVRNPLFGLSATLDAMEQVASNDPKQPYLRLMRGELDRISELMRDLLEYGRPPAVSLVPGALAPVVAQSVRACQPLAEKASVEIVDEVTAEAGMVLMDAARLAQVFQNLIENAIQHSPKGQRVRVVARRGESDVEVSVLDSGHGFREDDLPHIFDPFFSRRRGGTGLGLSIVQKIVEQHGGRIEAGNRPEGGARVSVRLPRRVAS
jgi:PAS domain S-box-containing protein